VERESVFEAWAPRGALWSAWVKPVLFAHVEAVSTTDFAPSRPDWLRRDLLRVEPSEASYRTTVSERPRDRRRPARSRGHCARSGAGRPGLPTGAALHRAARARGHSTHVRPRSIPDSRCRGAWPQGDFTSGSARVSPRLAARRPRSACGAVRQPIHRLPDGLSFSRSPARCGREDRSSDPVRVGHRSRRSRGHLGAVAEGGRSHLPLARGRPPSSVNLRPNVLARLALWLRRASSARDARGAFGTPVLLRGSGPHAG
jgi:hypothetical protein